MSSKCYFFFSLHEWGEGDLNSSSPWEILDNANVSLRVAKIFYFSFVYFKIES